MKKFKVAVVGCGRIAYKHVEGVVGNHEQCEIVAFCDTLIEKSEQRRDEYKEKTGFNASVYADYKDMIEKEEIDIVAISTESGYHAEIGLYCMGKGKHLVVEKPMALSTKDADMMIEMAKKQNVKLCVCHQNRFNPPIQKLRTAVEKEAFGKIINCTARILWNRNQGYYSQAPWRGTWELDGGTLMNQCIHNIDLLQWTVGSEVESVYSQCGTFLRDIEGEDFGAIMVKFKNGTVGLIEGTACVYPKNLEETLSVFGEKGTVCIGGLAVNTIETWKFADEEIQEMDLGKDREIDSVYGFGHIPLYKDFIESIIEDRDPLISGEEGKKALEIILGAYKSRLVDGVVKFPLGDFSTLDMKEIN